MQAGRMRCDGGALEAEDKVFRTGRLRNEQCETKRALQQWAHQQAVRLYKVPAGAEVYQAVKLIVEAECQSSARTQGVTAVMGEVSDARQAQ